MAALARATSAAQVIATARGNATHSGGNMPLTRDRAQADRPPLWSNMPDHEEKHDYTFKVKAWPEKPEQTDLLTFAIGCAEEMGLGRQHHVVEV